MKLTLDSITKRYGPVVANDRISLEARAGEVHCLLGENGAGKTTLMNVLYGLSRADEGRILVDDKAVEFDGPADAIAAGIGMVHQHFMLIPVFTVTENVILGAEPRRRFGALDAARARRRVSELSNQFGLSLDPDALVEDLPVGVQQRVEIVKTLYRDARALIFDEPTAVLTPQEVAEFFKIVRGLTASGKAVLFITHKLNEVLEIADRITVIRHGRVVGEADPKTTTTREIAEMMVGRPIGKNVERAAAAPGEVVLDLDRVSALSRGGEALLRDLSFNVRAGEIVGIAGVHGNGQTELVELVAGLAPALGGEVRFLGSDWTDTAPRDRHRGGLAHIPEDRNGAGVASPLPIFENLVLDSYYEERFSGRFQIHWDRVLTEAKALASRFDIRTPDVRNPADSLSGGNLQKLVIARELSRPVKLIIAAQPTRGVDVGSIEYIHKTLIEQRNAGVAVLLVSTELDEIIGLSDRILVIFQGQITAEFESRSADRAQIGLAMAGMRAVGMDHMRGAKG